MRTEGLLGRWQMLGNRLKLLWLRFFVIRTWCFSAKKRISVSSQYWPNNRRFFTIRNAHWIFSFLPCRSPFPIFRNRLLFSQYWNAFLTFRINTKLAKITYLFPLSRKFCKHNSNVWKTSKFLLPAAHIFSCLVYIWHKLSRKEIFFVKTNILPIPHVV